MNAPAVPNAARRGIRAAQLGILAGISLAAVKFVAGVVGNSYALIADAVESTADVFASLVVWGGLRVGARDPDERYPFGYGKAESLATALVALVLLAAAAGIAFQAIREMRTPHEPPAAWTLGVLVTVIVVKWLLARRVGLVGVEIGSTAVRADAWHHLSDAITSAAALVGIGIAVLATRVFDAPAWAIADEWAALAASAVIVYNGINLLRVATDDLMDRMAGEEVLAPVRAAALEVAGVQAIEKLAVRRTGLAYRATIHVQADPAMSLHDAHVLSGKVKSAIRGAVPAVQSVLVHMEPFE